MSERFAADWLALRASADTAARAADLARRFLAAVPPGATVVDLGAGTGANARYLDALDAAPRQWRLAEADPALLAAAEGLADRVEPWPADLAAGPFDALLSGVAGVTAAAFLDIVSADWIARIVPALAERRLPVLAALSVDGRILLDPPDPVDGPVLAGFVADQSRDKGFGPALGGHAADAFAAALEAAGYAVSRRRSDWHLPGAAGGLSAAYLRGLALEAGRDPAVADWLRRRLAAAAAGRLDIRVGHLDLLGLPPGFE